MIENLTVAELSSWLASQPENTTETPYEINLTDVTDTNITYIKSYLQANPTKYVNLSPTYITNYSMSLSYLFENCTTLIESPRFATPTFGFHPSMYAAFRGCTNLKYGYLISGTQDASNAFQGCTSLISFPGGITSYLRDISYFCYGCTSLQSMPYLPDVTNMEGAFRDCTSLTSITNIPSSVRNIAYAFKGCTGITSAPDIPYGITSLESTFEGCTALEECGSIANSVTNFTKTFKGCSSMTTFPDISSNGSIGIMEGTFEGCTGITTFSFPLSVRNVKNCFKGVTSLETVNNVPSGITNAESCFEGCTSLTTINLFSIPLDTLKNNVNFKDMFKGCTSLTSIGSAVEESDDWHIFYFKVISYSTYSGIAGIEGRIYDREGNYTEVSYYNYSGNINMVFFQLTDELWFPPHLMTDADVFSVIEKVISKKVSYFNKEVVDPEKKTFIMYADDPEEVHTNLKLGGGITVYDTEEELEEDLPNLSDGDIVGTYGDDLDILSSDNKAIIINSSMISYSGGVCFINLGTGMPTVGSVYKLYFGEGIVNGSAISRINITSGNISGNLATGKGNVASHYVTEFTHGGTSIAPTNIAIDWYTILDVMWNGSDWLIIGNPEVVNYKGSNNNNYIIYANGYIKQSGLFTGDEWQIIPLYVAYSDKNYIVLGTVDTSYRGGDAVFNIDRKSASFTTTQMRISTWRGGDTGALHNWVTMGY